MRLLRINWPEQWTAPWREYIRINSMPGLPRLPVHLQITMDGESYVVTAVARARNGDLICERRS